MDYQQDLRQSDPVAYETYSIGDVIDFAGSNWRVIKNSTAEEDYVTLMKEKILTNSELGSYGAFSSDYMPYYWSDTCHIRDHYGYSSNVTTNCAGHNDYLGSKVKEMLETSYLLTLNESSLKEIDGYKIRLITKDELLNLGFEITTTYSAGQEIHNYDDSNVPDWVVDASNHGTPILSTNYNYAQGYWTMTPSSTSNTQVYAAYNFKSPSTIEITAGNYYMPHVGVRPVINLLKSAIE